MDQEHTDHGDSRHPRFLLVSCAVKLRYAGLRLALPLLATEKTDVIVLMNGDRMTGEVKNLRGTSESLWQGSTANSI